jgi:hypothetical protein
MNHDETIPPKTSPEEKPEAEEQADRHCPVCGATLLQEKCKVVCRSPKCTYRIIFNCSEF